MPLLTLLNDTGSGGGTTTTNYALLLALTSDVVTPPPSGTTNYALLLALTSEAGETPPEPPPRRAVGRIEPEGGGKRRRISAAELERRIAEQRGNTFGRRWFDEFIAAEKAAQQAAQAEKKRAPRKALKTVAEAAREVRRDLELLPTPIDLARFTRSLEALTHARQVESIIAQAKQAMADAELVKAAIRHAIEQDDDEAIMLLLS